MMQRLVLNAALRCTVWEKQSQKEFGMSAAEVADAANPTDEWRMNASAFQEAAQLWVLL